ncbi:methylamine utilization protein [Sphingomonas solaris]|uniref:Methylamine utilization protein n=1 Tax=Alterirhizorhabdus solaris TaxID=2529389 RepID=A0A558RBT4_9SPHN|nr:methylamine utilization protein [Sphingomonas solaris]TVV76834.1 methylamine utilization protein [Sphingomonas solaris]
MIDRRILAAGLAAALSSCPAAATTVDVIVRDSGGNVVPNAVVMLQDGTPASARTVKFPWPYVVAQQNIQFTRYVLIVPVGAQVSFPNRDKVRHHVYSFSKAKRFELKLYGQEEARTVTFDKPGVVALGCNIHDPMTAFIMVVDTRFAARTDASGRVSITGVPGGNVNLRVWHPLARAPGGEQAQPLSVPASGAIARVVSLNLRSAARG